MYWTRFLKTAFDVWKIFTATASPFMVVPWKTWASFQGVNDAIRHQFVHGHQGEAVEDLIEHTTVHPFEGTRAEHPLQFVLNVTKHPAVTVLLHPSVPGPSVLETSEEGVGFAAFMGEVLDLILAHLGPVSTPAPPAPLT